MLCKHCRKGFEGAGTFDQAQSSDARRLLAANGAMERSAGQWVGPALREDRTMHAAPWLYGPDAHPSGIRKSLLSVFPPSICDDAYEMMVFPQRYLGSCLVYEKTESMIGIGIGRGNNGKSDLITLLENFLS